VGNISAGITVGASSDGTLGWQGDIAEVLVYDHQLTTSELQDVGIYLTGKYNVSNDGVVPTSGSGSPAPVITSTTTASGTSGTAFSYTIAATNTPTNFGATGLPAGLSIDTTTGIISGTPTSAGTFGIPISATNGGGTDGAILNLTIAPGTPVITSATTASAAAGANFDYIITANYGPTSFSADTLPAGLTLNTMTGEITGVPTASPGVYNVSLGAINSAGTGTATLAITVLPPIPVAIGDTTATVAVGNQFNYSAAWANNPTSFSVSGLPAGLTMDSEGNISGAPLSTGTSTITLSGTNANGTGSITLDLAVTRAGIFTCSSSALATKGTLFSYLITTSVTPTSFSATGLPDGMTLDTSTGIISGTPTTVGTNYVTLSVTDSTGMVTTAPLLIVVGSDTSTVTTTITLQYVKSPTLSYQGSTWATIDSDYPLWFDAPEYPQFDFSSQESYAIIVGKQTSTEKLRSLLSYDLSPLPLGAMVTDASLSFFGVSANLDGVSDAGPGFEIDLYQTGYFNPFTANWTDNNSYIPALLSKVTGDYSQGGGPITMPSGDDGNFVNAVQSAHDAGAPLYLMLLSPTAEADSAINSIYASVQTYPFGGYTYQNPALTLTYTTAAPPVITSAATALLGSSFDFQVTSVNGATSYTATGLPSGLSINSTTGEITGTTSETGVFPDRRVPRNYFSDEPQRHGHLSLNAWKHADHHEQPIGHGNS
jgi:hypothetical protein